MSYILDSLKKSDQERKRGLVPDLHSDHRSEGSDLRPPRRRWPFLLGGLLLLAGFALAAWLQPWWPIRPAGTVPTTATSPASGTKERAAVATKTDARPTRPDAGAVKPAAAARAVAPASSPAGARAEVAEGGEPSPARPAVVGSVTTPIRRSARDNEGSGVSSGTGGPAAAGSGVEVVGGTGGMTKPAPAGLVFSKNHPTGGPGAFGPKAVLATPSGVSPAGKESAPAAASAPTAVPAAPPASEKPAATPAVPETGASEAKTPEAALPEPKSPAGQESGQPAAPETGQSQQPPELDRLPASVRSGLPDVHVAAHYFTEDPETRLISVSGHILRQGQSMGDLKVVKITADGVIFSYHGRKFFVDVLNQ